LKSLCRLKQRTEEEIREKSISTSDHIDPHQQIDLLWDLNTFNEDSTWRIWSDSFLDIEYDWWRFSLFFEWNSYPYHFIGSHGRFHYIDEDLKPIRNKVTKYMYKFLLRIILEEVSAKTSDHKFDNFDRLTYQAFLDNILNRNTVQVAIQENILSEICELTAKVEQKYTELQRKMHAYERNLITLIEDQTQSDSLRQIFRTIGESTLKRKQNETLTCERTLNKLYEYESVLTNIRNTVLKDLRHQFMKDITGFIDRRYNIWLLLNSISLIQKKNKELLKLKKKNRIYTSTEYRPLPKIQRKYTTR
jgi:hypothetical protein